MKVLITGGDGMVARAAAAHCASLRDEVTALKRRELDIADREAVIAAFDSHRPQVVLNCAAYTDVDGAEANEKIAYAANAVGPENLASASKEFGASFVTISTDYVFDGRKDGFYTQDDPPNPQSVYALSKYEGETRSTEANPDSIIVRSGWIYGHGGTNFLSVLRRLISSGNGLKAIGDSFGTPTFAGDLAARLRELAAAKEPGIFHAANGGPGMSYYGFACAVANELQADAEAIERVSQLDLDRPAKRPVNSRLRCLRSLPMRDWREALREFLTKKGGT